MGDQIQTINHIGNLNLARSTECDFSDVTKHCNINKPDLTVISQNIQSMYCNLDNLLINVSCLTFEVDIIFLTECRLYPDKPIPQLENYN